MHRSILTQFITLFIVYQNKDNDWGEKRSRTDETVKEEKLNQVQKGH